MTAGPKKAADTSLLLFKSEVVGAERFAVWCERFLIVPRGRGAGVPFRIRGWQVDMLRPFRDPDPRPVVGAIMVLGGLGKTGIFSALRLYETFTGPDCNEIPIVAVCRCRRSSPAVWPRCAGAEHRRTADDHAARSAPYARHSTVGGGGEPEGWSRNASGIRRS